MGASFDATNKRLAATDKVLKYKRGLESLRKEVVRSGGANVKAATGIEKIESWLGGAKEVIRKFGLSVSRLAEQQRYLDRELSGTAGYSTAL